MVEFQQIQKTLLLIVKIKNPKKNTKKKKHTSQNINNHSSPHWLYDTSSHNPVKVGNGMSKLQERLEQHRNMSDEEHKKLIEKYAHLPDDNIEKMKAMRFMYTRGNKLSPAYYHDYIQTGAGMGSNLLGAQHYHHYGYNSPWAVRKTDPERIKAHAIQAAHDSFTDKIKKEEYEKRAAGRELLFHQKHMGNPDMDLAQLHKIQSEHAEAVELRRKRSDLAYRLRYGLVKPEPQEDNFRHDAMGRIIL